MFLVHLFSINVRSTTCVSIRFYAPTHLLFFRHLCFLMQSYTKNSSTQIQTHIFWQQYYNPLLNRLTDWQMTDWWQITFSSHKNITTYKQHFTSFTPLKKLIKQKLVFWIEFVAHELTTKSVICQSVKKKTGGICFLGVRIFPYNEKIYKYIFLLYVFI